MKRLLLKWWCSLNYRYCKSNAYLATQRQEIIEAVWWNRQASEWQDQWRGV